MLIIDRQIRLGKTQRRARSKAKKLVKSEEHDFVTGTINYDGDREKAFYRFEVKHRLKKAGFRNLKLSKVLYSWNKWSQAGQAYFPSADPPWDWYISCRKPKRK
jgi:hypothetical protein